MGNSSAVKKTFFLNVACLVSAVILLSFGISYADNDAGSGGDASNSMSFGSGYQLSLGTSTYLAFTGDLSSSDTTDMYKITVPAGKIVSVTIVTTNTATINNLNLYLWQQLLGTNPVAASTIYKNSFAGVHDNKASVSYKTYAALSFDIGILLDGFSLCKSTAAHYTFNVSITDQSEVPIIGGDAGNDWSVATTILEGTSTGYLDPGDSEDWYLLSGADAIENVNITASSGLQLKAYLMESSNTLDSKTIMPGDSAQLTGFLSKNYASYHYLRLSQVSGSGSYSMTIASKIDYQCVVSYPNPFDTSRGHKKITFAGTGVPYGKIRIYTFDAKLVKTLEETAGNSKLEREPVEDGIPSGIYYYGTYNPSETNKGELTIIR